MRFNPRAPCGARLPSWRVSHYPTSVSIHAPRGGRDHLHHVLNCWLLSFNPRAPCGARLPSFRRGVRQQSFNPRAPCGARPALIYIVSLIIAFQSTRPVRGATANEVTTSLFCHIFMGVTRHKYDFLGILSHAPPPAWFAHLYFYTVFSVHFTFALQKNAQMMMADSKS